MGNTWTANQAASAAHMPRALPPGWRDYGGGRYRSANGLGVIASVEEHPAHGQWLHVSASRPSRTPTWADMAWVKRLFVGRDRQALQVMPREAEHVNIHPHVLHIWCRLDAPDGLPDFRRDGGL